MTATTETYWSIHGIITRFTGGSVKCTVDFITSNSTLKATTDYSNPTVTLSSPLTLEVTGSATSANEVKFEMGSIEWKPMQ